MKLKGHVNMALLIEILNLVSAILIIVWIS